MEKLTVVAQVLLLFSSVPQFGRWSFAAASVSVPPNATLVDGVYYVRNLTNPVSWSEAKRFCEANGGSLPSPRTAAQYERMLTGFRNAPPGSIPTYFWFDVHRNADGIWKHAADGSALAFSTGWKSGYPTGAAADCVLYWSGMVNYACSWTGDTHALCAYRQDNATVSASTPHPEVVDDDGFSYVLDETKGPMSWTDAKQFCEGNGGSLPSPRTAAQYQRMYNQLQSAYQQNITKYFYPLDIRRDAGGVYRHPDGTSLAYNNTWDQNHPTETAGYDCVFFWYSGIFNAPCGFSTNVYPVCAYAADDCHQEWPEKETIKRDVRNLRNEVDTQKAQLQMLNDFMAKIILAAAELISHQPLNSSETEQQQQRCANKSAFVPRFPPGRKYFIIPLPSSATPLDEQPGRK